MAQANSAASFGTITVNPSAHRLINSMRDIGYDPSTAIADLVDNSISAGANLVEVLVNYDGVGSRIAIIDDGCGMTPKQLDESLRFGSRRTYDNNELGRFGLGLKTASLSLGRRLSVLSRHAPSRSVVHSRILDLDHIAEVDRWEVLAKATRSVERFARENLADSMGTVVVIENLDRLLPDNPASGWARRRFTTVERSITSYLGMVFHRFIEGDGRPAITITVNGEKVAPWNPFAPSEPATQVLERRLLEVETENGSSLVSYQPYVLPPRNKFSSQEEFERMSGPRRWNRQQGLYVYRAGRLVQSGGWAGIRSVDEHTKFARAAIDFDTDLDDAFKIDVAKMRVRLPPELRRSLERSVNELCTQADLTYRSAAGASESEWKRRDSSISGIDARDVALALSLAAVDIDEFDALNRLMDEVRKSHPEVATQLGWSKS